MIENKIIHDFRLGVKLWKAYNRHAPVIFPKDKSLAKIYDLSGQIRNIEIQVNLLNNLSSKYSIDFPELTLYFENQHTLDFAKLPAQFPVLPPLPVLSHTRIWETLGYIRTAQLINPADFETFHALRKKIKDIVYLCRNSELIEQGILSKDLGKACKKISDQMGEMQDYAEACRCFSHLRKNGIIKGKFRKIPESLMYSKALQSGISVMLKFEKIKNVF